MTVQKFPKYPVLGLVLLCSVAMFAANKASVQIMNPVTVNGQQLKSGNYSVQWDGSGSDVHVQILRGKKVVATSDATMVDMDHPAPSDSVIVNTNPDGTKSLTQIRFGGKKYALSLQSKGEPGGAGGASGAAK